jgi:hypothetical protein
MQTGDISRLRTGMAVPSRGQDLDKTQHEYTNVHQWTEYRQGLTVMGFRKRVTIWTMQGKEQHEHGLGETRTKK